MALLRKIQNYVESDRCDQDVEAIDKIADRIAWIGTIILGVIAVVYGFKFLIMDGRIFQ